MILFYRYVNFSMLTKLSICDEIINCGSPYLRVIHRSILSFVNVIPSIFSASPHKYPHRYVNFSMSLISSQIRKFFDVTYPHRYVNFSMSLISSQIRKFFDVTISSQIRKFFNVTTSQIRKFFNVTNILTDT